MSSCCRTGLDHVHLLGDSLTPKYLGNPDFKTHLISLVLRRDCLTKTCHGSTKHGTQSSLIIQVNTNQGPTLLINHHKSHFLQGRCCTLNSQQFLVLCTIYILVYSIYSTLHCKLLDHYISTKMQDIYNEKKCPFKTNASITIIHIHECRKTWKP